MRLPNLVIAGVGKAGTTSLFRWLGQHPDICPSDVKELGWFLGPAERRPPLDEYAAHFAGCGDTAYAMEASPGYFSRGAPLVAALREHLDDPRVILSLRDPVRRLWSHYSFLRTTGQIDAGQSFEGYLARCEEFHADGDRHRASPFAGLTRGCYADYLDPWLDGFGGDRLRIVFFEHLVARPTDEVGAILTWLELDPSPAAGFDYRAANQTMEHRSTLLRDAKRRFLGRADRWLLRHRRLRGALRRGYRAVNEAPPATASMTEDTQARLTDFYAPANARLADVLRGAGVSDLPAWMGASADR